MTAKEKAKQLYDKMEFETKYNSQPSTVQGMCKKLALICVDEILEFAYDIESVSYTHLTLPTNREV